MASIRERGVGVGIEAVLEILNTHLPPETCAGRQQERGASFCDTDPGFN